MSDLMFYGLGAVFFTGVITWLLAALYLVVGVVRGLVWCLRRATGRHRRTATADGCPECGGGMETCRCGTERPRLPHQSGGAR